MNRKQGFTLIELMIVVAIIAIIAAIAIPSLLNARMAGNEASAIASLRTLTTVQEQYRTRFQWYSPTMANLQAAGYIDNVLAAAIAGSGKTKSGYTFTDPNGTQTDWEVQGAPESFNQTGSRNFAVDESGVIRWNNTSGQAVTFPVAGVGGDPAID
jgi:type IV pilus assembly protein PilA